MDFCEGVRRQKDSNLITRPVVGKKPQVCYNSSLDAHRAGMHPHTL